MPLTPAGDAQKAVANVKSLAQQLRHQSLLGGNLLKILEQDAPEIVVLIMKEVGQPLSLQTALDILAELGKVLQQLQASGSGSSPSA